MNDLKISKIKSSKRYSLGRLATGWRESIFTSIHSERLKIAVAVITATGCRPSELELGVIVQFRNDGVLRVGIQGTKVSVAQHRGQPLRLLHIDDKTPWGMYLKECAMEAGGILSVTYDSEGISQRLREKSRELWPRRASLVSAYSYRHFLGRSMKESGLPPNEIAKVLGHASDFAQNCYGRAGGGKKTAAQHGIIKAFAMNPIRHSPKTDRFQRFIRPNNLRDGLNREN